MKRFLLLILIITAVMASAAQSEEITLKVRPRTRADVATISKLCSIENAYRDGTLLVYTEPYLMNSLLPYITSMERVTIPVSASAKMATSVDDFTGTWSAYPTWSVFDSTMKRFTNVYPNLCRLDTIGYTNKGKPLYFIHISGSNNALDTKPKVMYVSSIHGNELTGCMLMCRFVNNLLSGYNANSIEGARITRLLDSLDIWIMPMNNPDGTYPTSDNSVLNSKRTNFKGKDLNRDFPEQYTDPVNTTTGRQIETAAMMNFVKGKNFTLSANFHTGTVVVNYPWDALEDGSTSELIAHNCPDSTWYVGLSNTYASNNIDFSSSKEFNGGIVNGAYWYTVYGGRQDWIYSFHNCRETTIELSEMGIQDSAELVRQWAINHESLMLYLEQALYGFQGRVFDENSKPLAATITLEEINANHIVSDSSTGFYARLTHPGAYNVICSKDGFFPDTLRNATLMPGERIVHDFVLKENRTPAEDTKEISIQATAQDGYLLINGTPNGEAQIEIYSILGERCRSFNGLPIESGKVLLPINGMVSGAYYGQLKCAGRVYAFRFIVHS